VLLGELSDLVMLELQDRFDLFVERSRDAANHGKPKPGRRKRVKASRIVK
jgi:hypothetical protein